MPGLPGMTGLRKLVIKTDGWSDFYGDLPGGPYLSRLEILSLENYPEVPEELAAATRLQYL